MNWRFVAAMIFHRQHGHTWTNLWIQTWRCNYNVALSRCTKEQNIWHIFYLGLDFSLLQVFFLLVFALDFSWLIFLFLKEFLTKTYSVHKDHKTLSTCKTCHAPQSTSVVLNHYSECRIRIPSKVCVALSSLSITPLIFCATGSFWYKTKCVLKFLYCGSLTKL